MMKVITVVHPVQGSVTMSNIALGFLASSHHPFNASRQLNKHPKNKKQKPVEVEDAG